jgi:hypothetical protein
MMAKLVILSKIEGPASGDNGDNGPETGNLETPG